MPGAVSCRRDALPARCRHRRRSARAARQFDRDVGESNSAHRAQQVDDGAQRGGDPSIRRGARRRRGSRMHSRTSSPCRRRGGHAMRAVDAHLQGERAALPAPRGSRLRSVGRRQRPAAPRAGNAAARSSACRASSTGAKASPTGTARRPAGPRGARRAGGRRRREGGGAVRSCTEHPVAAGPPDRRRRESCGQLTPVETLRRAASAAER